MVSSATAILDSGYTISLIKSYTGTSTRQRLWAVYPNDTEWYWSDAHGNQPRTKTCTFSFSKSKYADWDCPYSPSIGECSFVSKFNGFRYDVSITNTWVKTVSKCASMEISNMYVDATAYPDSTEFITVDISNIGGDGSFDLVLLDGTVEIYRISNGIVSENGSSRETLQFMMLNKTMNLTIQLVDNYDTTVVDEKTHTITLPDPCDGVICDPSCVGDDLYENVCIEGVCIRGSLIEADNMDVCGYVPPDPCDGVICDPECVGNDLYSQVCDAGICIRGVLIESDNAEVCGYVPPEPDPTPDPDPDPEPDPDTDENNYITYIVIIIAFIYIITR